METFMNGSIVIEGVALSVLLAVWMTWLGLRGLFSLMPIAEHNSRPIRPVSYGQKAAQGRQAA